MIDHKKLSVDDIENILDEPRIRSDVLARRLGMTPRNMRRLIEKHRKELEAISGGPLVEAPGRPK
jgi:hypothetical protein